MNKRQNIIIGNSIGSYVMAACLDYKKEDFEIWDIHHGQNKGNKATPVLFLKYMNDSELKLYFNIFKIDYTEENIKKYTKLVKVGYLDNNGHIYDSLTQEMFYDYLKKQSRSSEKTSMSDGLNSYNAILLHKVFDLLKENYENKKHNVNSKEIKGYNLNIYDNTENFIQDEGHKIYLSRNTEFDIEDYDYVYDCNPYSNIKRITKEYVEYIGEPNVEHFTILNFYNSPAVYTKFDIKTNNLYTYIGRYSTKSQTKQEDIIKYMLEGDKR